MKWYLMLIPLLILSAGCVGADHGEEALHQASGVWIHDSGSPVFLFQFNPGGVAQIWFMALDDPARHGHPVMVMGTWTETGSGVDIGYKAPLSGEKRTLQLEWSAQNLILTGALMEDGTPIDIADLRGTRFIRGESYSAPIMGFEEIDLFLKK